MPSTKLTRSVTTTGNQKTFTISVWVKRSSLGTNQFIFSAKNVGETTLYFRAEDDLQLELYDGNNYYIRTTRLFRDTNAWYHIVAIWDSVRPTSSDRMRLYVNGVQETSLSAAVYPPQNYDSYVNQSGELNQIGTYAPASTPSFDGSMSHFHLIDGNDYNASYFGEYDANGVWTIKTDVSVTYGTNGFFILKDGNSVTDQSGNGNNFTVAGGNLTNTEDCPSNVFATLNPLDTADATDFSSLLSEGNLTLGGSANDKGLRGTLGANSGKFYWEIKANDISDTLCVARSDVRLTANNTSGTPSTGFWGVQSNGTGASINTYENGTFDNTNALQGFASNTIIGIALDMDNGKIYYSFNGVFKGRDNNSSDPVNQTNPFFSSLPTDGTFIMPFTENRSSGGSTFWNYGNGHFGTTAVSSAGTNASGNGIFEYDVPTGYTALSTKGLNL